MRTRLALLLVVAGWLALTATAALADPQDDKARLADLIARLGSDSFREREAAMQALEEAGPRAVEALRKAIKNQDLEVRKRASDLVGLIEHREESARMIEPKKVHLRYNNTPLPEALTDFSRRVGFLIEARGDAIALRKKTITLDTGLVPFWEAFDQFCQKAGLTEPSLLPKPRPGKDAAATETKPVADVVREYAQEQEGVPLPGGGTPVLVLVEGKPEPVPTVTVGAVRIRHVPADRIAESVPVGANEKNVTLEIIPEPGLGLNDVLALRVSRAIDDKGQVLGQPAVYVGDGLDFDDQRDLRLWALQSSYLSLSENDSSPTQVPVRLQLARKPSLVLRELSGVVTARVQTPRQPLMAVESVMRAKGQSVTGPDGGSLSVAEVNRNASGQVVVRAVVTPIPKQVDGPAPVPWGRGRAIWARKAILAWRFNGDGDDPTPDLHLVDDRGQQFERVGMEQEANAKAGGTQYRLVFQSYAGQSIPARLVWYGRRTKVIDVPFTLRDLPLP